MGNQTMVSTEQEFEEVLQTILEDEEALDSVDGPEVTSVRTFGDVGMLTRDRGLVVRLRNGAEFQVTIVQSAGFKDEDEEEE